RLPQIQQGLGAQRFESNIVDQRKENGLLCRNGTRARCSATKSAGKEPHGVILSLSTIRSCRVQIGVDRFWDREHPLPPPCAPLAIRVALGVRVSRDDSRV